ncbi:MAG: hypothetical protein OQK98_02600 [Gammaproteobacteria bacterium]|nr:hypothetical protein [Gammaproteobacteria bacterium]
MGDESTESNDEFCFTKEGKSHHEIKYLKERVVNLEVFKKNFFSLNMQLIEAKEKVKLFEEQIQLEKLKTRISGLPDTFADSVDRGADLNDGLLSFFEDNLLADVYRDVVASIFHSVENLDLNVTVKITTDKESKVHSLDPDNQEEAVKIISQFNGESSFIKDKDFIIFYMDNIVLFANNMPVSDEVKSLQLEKYLKIVCVGANLRIDSLSKSAELDILNRNIYNVFKKTHLAFETMRDSFDDQAINISELYLGFESNLNESLKKMNLSDAYMEVLKLILYNARSELNLLLTSGMTFDENFLSSIVKLENAYASKYSEK